MVSVCLPSDDVLQHLPSNVGISYLGRGVSLDSCSSKAQPLLLTLNEVYLLTATTPELERGVDPLVPPVPPKIKKCKKAKWLSEEALQIAVKRREAKGREKERYTHLNAEF